MKGIAICWPNEHRRIEGVAARGSVPLHCRPLQARIPGSRLALVAPNGDVRLTCVLARIEGPQRVRLATGDYKKSGYELVAKPGTIRTKRQGSLGRLPFRWRFIGQLRYFDQRTFRPIMVGEPQEGGPFLRDGRPEEEARPLRFKPFTGGIPGLDRDHPESKLVYRFVTWLGSPDHFVHAQALTDGSYTDLFNTTRWTLFEAKAGTDDRRIREAFGQLYDYRRSFLRSPSIAVLLPARPRPRILSFLAHFGVAAVWKRSGGSFADSVGGRLTGDLRSEYRARAR